MAFSIAIVYELNSGWRWRVLECLILKVETFVFLFLFFLLGGGCMEFGSSRFSFFFTVCCCRCLFSSIPNLLYTDTVLFLNVFLTLLSLLLMAVTDHCSYFNFPNTVLVILIIGPSRYIESWIVTLCELAFLIKSNFILSIWQSLPFSSRSSRLQMYR